MVTVNGVGGGATGTQWVEARDAGIPPTTHKTASHNKEFSGMNISSASAEKSCFQKYLIDMTHVGVSLLELGHRLVKMEQNPTKSGTAWRCNW